MFAQIVCVRVRAVAEIQFGENLHADLRSHSGKSFAFVMIWRCWLNCNVCLRSMFDILGQEQFDCPFRSNLVILMFFPLDEWKSCNATYSSFVIRLLRRQDIRQVRLPLCAHNRFPMLLSGRSTTTATATAATATTNTNIIDCDNNARTNHEISFVQYRTIFRSKQFVLSIQTKTTVQMKTNDVLLCIYFCNSQGTN